MTEKYAIKQIQDLKCEMDLDQAITELKKEYQQALRNKTVQKPLAYALYQVWKKVDRA